MRYFIERRDAASRYISIQINIKFMIIFGESLATKMLD